MFQYTQALLDALRQLDHSKFEIVRAYQGEAWELVLKRLQLSGHRLTSAKWGKIFSEILTVLNIPGGIARLISRLNPLVRELEALHADIWIFPAQESVTYQMSMPVIGTIHDLMHRYEPSFPEVGSPIRRRTREFRLKNIAHKSAAILVDSSTGARHVSECYQADLRKVFPLPYVAPAYIWIDSERIDFDDLYQLPKKFVFYPAQFWSHKNHKRLIEAVRLVRRRCPDVAIVFAGSKQKSYVEVETFVKTIGMESCVRFVGYVPDLDLRGFYKRARALVMPSFFGPTNIPPMEAMAVGCPVLVSDIYGMPEQCGDAALYFDPKSTEQIADRIEAVWTDDGTYEYLSSKGLARATNYKQAHFNELFTTIIKRVTQNSDSISTDISNGQS